MEKTSLRLMILVLLCGVAAPAAAFPSRSPTCDVHASGDLSLHTGAANEAPGPFFITTSTPTGGTA